MLFRSNTRPTQTAQPPVKSIRYADPRSARAEEGLIRLLSLDPGLAKGRDLPAPEDFSSPELGKIYDELLFRIRNGEALSPGVLAARLTPDEMSLFVAIQGGTVDMANADRAMADYIKIIAARKDQQMDLRELAEQKRKKVSEGKP